MSGTTNTLTIAVPASASIRYFLTVSNNAGGAFDTPWTTFTATTGGNTTGTGTVYRDCNYSGASVGLAVGRYTLSQLLALGVRNDDVSSLRVTSGYKITAYEHDNFTGRSVVKTGDDSCLVDDSFNDLASSIVVEANGTTTDPGTPGTANGTHKRLKIVNGCGSPMWVQWLTAPGINFNATNFKKLDGLGSFTEFDIPDKGLPSMRFWPGFGCDANGKNCRVGSSGGPAALGFTCPPTGCAPPIDSKFEASFGCIPGVTDAQCVQNPSAPGQPLGRGDWWNSSFVDGYTTPMKVVVHGNCPTGPQPAPVFGPGGPPGGVIDCSTIRVSDCPTNENLSTNGQFPQFNSVNLIATNPATGAVGGCYSPAAKLTFNHWANGFPTYPADSAQAQMYACPTPPISPDQCSAGPAARTKFHDMVHTHCATYTYPYDDGVGLSSCPAATNLSYEVTFYCPQ
ncbi:MAG: carbohydrate-binding protein [Moraxellaceae bacterium]|nr:MAG: carbohydrate-binding protein [Moraxellaceae bacterium]